MNDFTPTMRLEYSDPRGELYVIEMPDDQELLLFHSKKGSLRGGHAHDVNEIVVMLKGAMMYHKQHGVGEELRRVNAGDASFNPAGMPHMGEFLEDSWLIEFKLDGTKKGQAKNIDHEPYRALVKANAAAG